MFPSLGPLASPLSLRLVLSTLQCPLRRHFPSRSPLESLCATRATSAINITIWSRSHMRTAHHPVASTHQKGPSQRPLPRPLRCVPHSPRPLLIPPLTRFLPLSIWSYTVARTSAHLRRARLHTHKPITHRPVRSGTAHRGALRYCPNLPFICLRMLACALARTSVAYQSVCRGSPSRTMPQNPLLNAPRRHAPSPTLNLPYSRVSALPLFSPSGSYCLAQRMLICVPSTPSQLSPFLLATQCDMRTSHHPVAPNASKSAFTSPIRSLVQPPSLSARPPPCCTRHRLL